MPHSEKLINLFINRALAFFTREFSPENFCTTMRDSMMQLEPNLKKLDLTIISSLVDVTRPTVDDVLQPAANWVFETTRGQR